MVRLLHLADLHLDSPFRGLRQTRPELADVLRDASLAALDQAVLAAIELKRTGGLDAVTFAGDLFDAGSPSLRARNRLTRALRQLDAAGIRCFIATGNHDPIEGGDTWPRVALPSNTRLFPGSWVEEPLLQNGHHVASLIGRSYSASDADQDALAGLPKSDAPLRIGLLHTDVDGSSGERSYAPVRLQALRESRFDAWLLGHVHGRRELCSQPLVVYPGSPQGRDMGSGELGAKGALLVEFKPGKPPASRFVPLGSIAWAVLEVDISGCGTEQDVVDAAQDALRSSLADPMDVAPAAVPPLVGLIARVRFVGTAATAKLWQWLGSPSGLSELAETLKAEERRPFVLVEEVLSDAAGPLPERSLLEARADLLGDFLRLLGEARKPGTAAAQTADLALAVFGQRGAAKEYREVSGWAPDGELVLAQAERLVLTHLLPLLEASDDHEA